MTIARNRIIGGHIVERAPRIGASVPLQRDSGDYARWQRDARPKAGHGSDNNQRAGRNPRPQRAADIDAWMICGDAADGFHGEPKEAA